MGRVPASSCFETSLPFTPREVSSSLILRRIFKRPPGVRRRKVWFLGPCIGYTQALFSQDCRISTLSCSLFCSSIERLLLAVKCMYYMYSISPRETRQRRPAYKLLLWAVY